MVELAGAQNSYSGAVVASAVGEQGVADWPRVFVPENPPPPCGKHLTSRPTCAENWFAVVEQRLFQ